MAPLEGLSLIRSIIEMGILASLQTAGLAAEQAVFDNTMEDPPAMPYADVSVSFVRFSLDRLSGCGPGEHITGSMQVTIYEPLGHGGHLGQQVAEEVLRGWVQAAGARWDGTGARVCPLNLEGPQTVPLNTEGRKENRQRNAHATVVAASFVAQVA